MPTHKLEGPTSFVKKQQYNQEKYQNNVPRGMNWSSGAYRLMQTSGNFQIKKNLHNDINHQFHGPTSW
ncbi:hypothetical protein EMIT0P4_250033 [Pseudomonas sp. IT-P4]